MGPVGPSGNNRVGPFGSGEALSDPARRLDGTQNSRETADERRVRLAVWPRERTRRFRAEIAPTTGAGTQAAGGDP